MGDEIIESAWFETLSKRIILVVILAAITIGLGFLFMGIPNIEFFTLFVFLSGFIMGKRDGLIIGLVSSLVYFGLNPFGFPPIGIYVFQVMFYAITGFLGALIQNFFQNKDYFKPKENLYILVIMIILGIVGFVFTFLYDIISSVIWYFEYPFGDFTTYIISGLVYNTIHLIFNLISFILILPGLAMLTCKLL